MKAIVLAGGKSSRMGQDKALMKLNGKYMIEYITHTLSQFFDEVLISGSLSKYDGFQNNVIEDLVNGKGPMGGIYSALEYCKEDIFVCSCDMPFISPDLIKNILQRKKENRINVVCLGKKIYPVLGIYPLSIINDLMKSIESENLRMTQFLELQNTHYIDYNDSPTDQFLNINTPENFQNAETIVNKIYKQ
ncbi:molybdenum cofactor guanylyltransferase [Chryseobacterium aurantiacum]|uniref:molybdenum cofactor guanylyltransferase n=1 Tax=Chryseobacterium aurantiacum TaxID=2116499 RepID=UPI000D11EE9E|nr:molybdenum cofactor guanylyltransferase [Chryseobacterium aurantiacum]